MPPTPGEPARATARLGEPGPEGRGAGGRLADEVGIMGQDTLTGTTIAGRYRVTGYYRPARMGDLYVARRLQDDGRVFVKLLDPKLLSDTEAQTRFEREIDVLSRVRHPCVLEVFDRGRTPEDLPWLVTEYVDGEPLSDLMDEHGPLPPRRAAWIAGQIALALRAAHDLDVVHRDLQPDNVLIADPGGVDRVKVVDFGLVRIVQTESSLTTAGVRVGTPYYMAPEYVRDYELDHRADLYSLGAMLFHLLTGRPPFEGRPYKVLDQHVNAPVPSAREAQPDVPAWLDELVQQLMQKEPLDRIQSAAEVVAAIEAGLGRPLLPDAPPEVETPAPEPEPEVAEIDPILERVMTTNILSLEVDRGPQPDLRDCLVVERVAEVSIAARAGVEPGDLLQLPDEPVSGLRSTALHQPVVAERTYVFTRADGRRITLRATGIPIGITALRHPEHVRRHYQPLNPDPEALLDLWKQQAWPVLESLAWRTLTQPKGALDGGMIARFLRTERIRLEDHPALVLHGASLVEQGRAADGMTHIQRFKSDFALHWPPIYNAIAHYYLAAAKVSPKTEKLAVDLLVQSWLLYPLTRTASALESLAGERPPEPPWEGNTFPDYLLDEVEGSLSASLVGSVQDMDESQLFVVCMMGGFRGSADYDAFMHRFAAWIGWFPDILTGLHVVTTATRRPDDHPEWFKGEDMVRQSGVRLSVLADERAFVQREVKPVALPTAYVLDKHRTVVHQGLLTAPDLWDALALAGRRRLERFRRR